MGLQVLSHRTSVGAKVKDVFAWHQRPGCIERLTPPWEAIQILHNDQSIQDRARVSLKLKIGPFWKRWHLEHTDYGENRQFSDQQIKGPFAHWKHSRFFSEKEEMTSLQDIIEYKLPLPIITARANALWVKDQLKNLLRYRHEILEKDLVTHNYNTHNTSLKVLITGASGLIGKALKPLLTTQGHTVFELSHSKKKDTFYWNPASGEIDTAAFEGVDAVVHLAGASILGYWSEKKKARIYESRIQSTRLLAKTLAKLDKKPKTLITASGINYYGSLRTERLHEQSTSGTGFLAHVCQDWEQATQAAKDAGIRVVNLRIGAVLSPAGGLLAQVLPFYKMCLGGRLGSGTQWMSWIAIDDLLDIIHFSLLNDGIAGPINATAPNPQTNFQFKQTLAKILKRPAWLPIPASLLQLLFGEMAKETMLSDLKVIPHKLLASGYRFRYPQLEDALRHVLGYRK